MTAWSELSDPTGCVVPDYGFTQAEREVASAHAQDRISAPVA